MIESLAELVLTRGGHDMLAPVETRAGQTLSAPPDPWLRDALGIQETHSGISVTAESSLRATAVFACVRVLSESVAGLPLHLYRRRADGGRERAADHPLYRVLHEQPNPYQTSYEFRQLMMTWLLLWGNAFSEIVRDDDGAVRELWPLRPDRIRVKAEAGRIAYEYTTPGGGNVPLPFERVLHLKGLSTDGLLGLSPIAAARQSIGLSLAAEQFGASYFGKGSRVGGVIELPNAASEPVKEGLREAWNRRHVGPDGFHAVAILDNGQKFTPFTISNEDSQFIETRRFSVEDIARIYRVPPHLIADLSRANYSNVDAMSREFVQHSLTPWLNTIEQRASVMLLGPYSRQRYFVEHDLRGILRGNHEAQMRAYSQGITSGIYSPNECRQWENLAPRDGGDVFLQPTNLAVSPFTPQQTGGQNDRAA